jgi:hypothetical protein
LSRKGHVPELDWPPPDPGKLRPGADGTAAGSKSKKSSTNRLQAKDTKARRPDQQKVVRHLAVAHGTGTAGWVDQDGRQLAATDVDGAIVGVFANVTEGANAISDAWEATHA